jgi:hypothetical protein
MVWTNASADVATQAATANFNFGDLGVTLPGMNEVSMPAAEAAGFVAFNSAPPSITMGALQQRGSSVEFDQLFGSGPDDLVNLSSIRGPEPESPGPQVSGPRYNKFEGP